MDHYIPFSQLYFHIFFSCMKITWAAQQGGQGGEHKRTCNTFWALPEWKFGMESRTVLQLSWLFCNLWEKGIPFICSYLPCKLLVCCVYVGQYLFIKNKLYFGTFFSIESPCRRWRRRAGWRFFIHPPFTAAAHGTLQPFVINQDFSRCKLGTWNVEFIACNIFGIFRCNTQNIPYPCVWRISTGRGRTFNRTRIFGGFT